MTGKLLKVMLTKTQIIQLRITIYAIRNTKYEIRNTQSPISNLQYPNPMLPTQIDRYQIIEECGRGGMAIVYRAYDTHRQLEIALKILPREYLHDMQFRARFKREIDINASFRHEAVVPIFGYGQYQGQLYLIMRYLPGGSLDDRMTVQKILSLEEMVRLLARLAPALDAAHQQGIIHRDMKPSNILFDEHGLAYIADFGIARLAAQASFTMLTGNSVLGSAAYMSPEQTRSGTAVDGRSDLYSFGVVLFEALTGQLPFYDSQPMQLAVKHISDPIPDILAFNGNLPASCRQFIFTALAKSPDERFQTAGEMANALGDVFRLSGRPQSAGRVQPNQPGPDIRPRAHGAPPPGVPGPRPLTPDSPPKPAFQLPKIAEKSLSPFLRRLTGAFRLPSALRNPSIPLPGFLRPITGFLGLPSAIRFRLPETNLGWLLSAGGIGLLILVILVVCVGLFYLLFKFGLPLLQ